ncbi:MAG TPA: BLUF domain-containing protein [Sphingomonas sp.]
MRTFLYISRNLLGAGSDDQMLDIRARSLARNSQLELSGMLVATPVHFVQVIEGPDESVEALVEILAADTRHTDPVTLDDRPIERRLFRRWTMLTFMAGGFLERYLEPAISVQLAIPAQGSRGEPMMSFLKRIEPGT